MTGDFILQARVELLGKGVDPHRKAGWMIRPSQDADAPYVDGVIHGDGLTSLQFRRTKGAITEQNEMTIKGARRHPARTQGRHLHLLGGQVRRPLHRRRGRRRQLSATRCFVGLALCSHNPEVTERAIFRDVRITRPAKDTLRSVPRLHRQRARDPRCRDRASAGHPQLAAAVRGAELDDRRRRADLQPERTRGGLGRAVPLRPRDAAVHAHRHRRRQPQQQRSRAVVRRHDARHQRSEPGVGRPLHRLHGAGRRRHAEADHHAVAVLPPRLVARRQGSDLHRRAEQRVRHLPHPGRRQRTGGQPHQHQGAGRRPGVHARRQVHLLQLGAQRDDADLADEAGRHGSRSRSPTTSTTTGSRTSRRTASGSRSSASRRTSTPTTIRTTSTSTCG